MSRLQNYWHRCKLSCRADQTWGGCLAWTWTRHCDFHLNISISIQLVTASSLSWRLITSLETKRLFCFRSTSCVAGSAVRTDHAVSGVLNGTHSVRGSICTKCVQLFEKAAARLSLLLYLKLQIQCWAAILPQQSVLGLARSCKGHGAVREQRQLTAIQAEVESIASHCRVCCCWSCLVALPDSRGSSQWLCD